MAVANPRTLQPWTTWVHSVYSKRPSRVTGRQKKGARERAPTMKAGQRCYTASCKDEWDCEQGTPVVSGSRYCVNALFSNDQLPRFSCSLMHGADLMVILRAAKWQCPKSITPPFCSWHSIDSKRTRT